MSDDGDKKLIVETLLTMYREQVSTTRHYEIIRSTATTIHVSLVGALIVLMAAVVRSGADTGLETAMFGVFLILLGVSGFMISMKSFERSVLSRTLAEAYKNTVNKMLEASSRTILSDCIADIEYIENAKDWIDPEKFRPFDFEFVNGKRRNSEKAVKKFWAGLENPNPMEPAIIAVPIHNAVTNLWGVNWPSLSQKHLWAVPHVGIVVIGLGVVVIGVVTELF